MCISIRSDRCQRAALDYFQTEIEFFRSFRLFRDVGIATFIPALEIVGSNFATQIAVEALINNIELPWDILRNSKLKICAHRFWQQTTYQHNPS